MKVIEAINVNDAYVKGLSLLQDEGVRESSRAGDVIVMGSPVTTVYEKSYQRVLFNEKRDANPFFHLMESVWMLAGSNNGKWLDRYVSDFSSRYAEEDGKINGAYGYRWRNHFDTDQLITIGNMLLKDPTTRRAVLAMWDPQTDLGADVKDMPCNTHIYFRVRKSGYINYLDMTVCCRSNDAIWGAYGANAVHMSVLQEVMAGLAECRVGWYYQISNNFHAYADVFKKFKPDIIPTFGLYPYQTITPKQICSNSHEAFNILRDSSYFCHIRNFYAMNPAPLFKAEFRTEWFTTVVGPMHIVHTLWKNGDKKEALEMTRHIESADWQVAVVNWMTRRINK